MVDLLYRLDMLLANDLSQEELNKRFLYKKGRIYRRFWILGCKPLHEPVGNPDRHGHLRVSVNRKKYSVHRIIWIMHNGAIPVGLVIDHKNQKRNDNMLENLRVVTQQQNLRNSKTRIDNRTGTTGVRWNKDIKKWTADIKSPIRTTLYLGSYETINEAIAARRAAELCLYYPQKEKAPLGGGASVAVS